MRIRIADLIDGPQRSVTQWLTRVVSKVTALAQAHPALTRQLLVAGGALLAMTATIGSLSLAIGVLAGPLAKLRLGFSLLTGSLNVVRVLPALWGMVTGSVSLLGGAIGALFSPVGLIAAAFVAAAVLIWKYWEPIKAFYAGVFSGIMERLAPLRETFERFGPVFDAIGSGISQVFNWFKSLLSPMESSKETLDKCTSAGEIFGNVLGGALQLVLTPAKMLLDTLAWILEKLGVLPDEAERARKKIEDAQRAAILQDKVALLQGDLAKINLPKPVENGNGTGGDKPKDNKPLTDSNTGTLRRLSKIADNTGRLVDETKNALAPAILSLRTCPAHLLFVGSGRSGRLRRSVSLLPQSTSHPWSRLLCLRRWSLLLRPAPARWRRPYDRQWHQFLQLPVTGSLLSPDLAVKFMFICITLLRRIPANWRNWSVKWSGQNWNDATVPDVAVFTIKIEESWP
ncbi:putative phage tail tape measure domain protein [Escherichia coli DEC12E]|nr:putative phage tail tape measure domain protein [Escherichia coli DEC12E]